MTVTILALALGMAASAAAPEDAPSSHVTVPTVAGWAHAGPQTAALGNANVDVLYQSGAQTLSVAFLCDDAAIQARLPAAPTDMGQALGPTFDRARAMRGTLTIDGETAYAGKFTYLPTQKVALPHERSVNARLYNAAIQGQAVTLRLKGQTHDLSLPPRGEALTAFHQSCQARGAF